MTSTNTGKAYAAAWSNNVKAEGEPVARFSDRETVNHASPVPNDGNGVLVSGAGAAGAKVNCDALIDEIELDLTDNKRVKRAQEGSKKKEKGRNARLSVRTRRATVWKRAAGERWLEYP